MQQVAGQWNGECKINGEEVPLMPSALLYLNVINSVHQQLPSLQLGFKDSVAAALTSMNLGDGSKIELTLGDGGRNQSAPMVFTIMGGAKIKGTYSGETIEFSAVLDHVKWMRKVVEGATKGTSGDAIAKVAQEAGLRVEKHTTSDSMVWLPNNKPLASFARSVMERGWASATSCMMIGVSDNSKLRYFDLDRASQRSGGLVFGNEGLPILTYQIDSKADLYNNTTAYGSLSTNITPEGPLKELNKISTRMIGNALNVGASIMGQLGDFGARILPKALEVGDNTHEKWNEAQHQNQRNKALYSNDVHILIDQCSGAELLDTHTLNLMRQDARNMESQSGSYIVSAFTRTLTNNRYFEKITLTSQ